MMLDSVKAGTVGLADTIAAENPKLLEEVIKLVESMGGVSGLVKRFQDRGLGNVASSLTGNGATKPISPEQIVQGLGTYTMNALATKSGLDVKVMRKQLVAILPMVVQQLAPTENPVEVAVAV